MPHAGIIFIHSISFKNYFREIKDKTPVQQTFTYFYCNRRPIPVTVRSKA